MAEAPVEAPEVSHATKWGKFVWEDPFLLEDQFTEEERMVRDTARAYAQDKLMPRVIQANRNETYDPALYPEMGALGLLGSLAPTQYGGSKLGHVAYGLIGREIEKVDSGYQAWSCCLWFDWSGN